ncbi:ATP-dependent 6-phosphofructokinase [Coprothermobacteraceae bacterium]|nr:ATP-dependent 6-phosphofructokinase [Coprothermobacteraceae bacterium]
MKRIGVLTGGGDAPGLNPAIRGVFYKASALGFEVVGIADGWKGLLEKKLVELTKEKVDEALLKGGTILGSSRTNPYKREGGPESVVANFKELGLDGLIAIGGEDTLGVAGRLVGEYHLPINGVPKTIDFDVPETDFTLGFFTALEVTTDILERLQDTANSHHRALVLEVMGRHAGWLGLFTAVAGGADYVLLPEQKPNVAHMLEQVKSVLDTKGYAVVVVSEGAILDENLLKNRPVDEFGHVQLGGVGESVAQLIQDHLGVETRCVILGHAQRGGKPSILDRILPQLQAIKAVEWLNEGHVGVLAAYREGSIKPIELTKVVGRNRPIPEELIKDFSVFFNGLGL